MPRQRLKSTKTPSPESVAILQAALNPPEETHYPVREVIKAAPEDENAVSMRELMKLGVDLKLTMLREFKRRGINTADWLKEIHATARVAAMEGDFNACFKGYEIIGKHLGALTGDTHLHLHAPAAEQMREMTDAQLQAMIQKADERTKTIEAIVLAEAATTTTADIPQEAEALLA